MVTVEIRSESRYFVADLYDNWFVPHDNYIYVGFNERCDIMWPQGKERIVVYSCECIQTDPQIFKFGFIRHNK